jgi:hypothetical protein
VVFLDLEQRDGAAVVEVGDVGLGVEVLAGDVAAVGGFEPVPSRLSALYKSGGRCDSRIIDDLLTVWVPACEIHVGVFFKVGNGVTVYLRTDSAFSFVLKRVFFNGKFLLF